MTPEVRKLLEKNLEWEKQRLDANLESMKRMVSMLEGTKRAIAESERIIESIENDLKEGK